MQSVSQWVDRLTRPGAMVLMLVLIVLSYMYIDQPLGWLMHDLTLRSAYPVLVWITQLGRSVPFLLVLPLIALYCRYGKRAKQMESRLWFLWVTLLVTNCICFGLKIMVGRARPELLFDQHLFGFYGFSMDSLYHSCPSGHTTFVTTAVLGLSMLYPAYRRFFIALGLVIVSTRILLTYHYLSDVLLSFYLVVLEYRVLLYVINRECPLYWTRLGLA